jgi:phage/plasmid-associated DNA primase
VPEIVRARIEQYREDADDVGTFLAERCRVVRGHSIPAATIYAAYERWAHSDGAEPLSQTAFGRSLSGRGFVRGRAGSPTRRVWFGLALLDPLDRFSQTPSPPASASAVERPAV